MKRIGLVFLLLVVSFRTFAQSEQNFSLGVGFFAQPYMNELLKINDGVEHHYPGPFDKGSYEFIDEKLRSLPVNLNFHYEHSICERFGVGVGCGYEHIRMKQESECVYSSGEQESPHGIVYTSWESYHALGKMCRNYFFIMPEVSVYWFKKKHVAMYSKVAGGIEFKVKKRLVTYPEEKKTVESDRRFCFQASPVCVEVGGQYWRGFAELGYGMQGIGQYGARHIIKGEKGESENVVIE